MMEQNVGIITELNNPVKITYTFKKEMSEFAKEYGLQGIEMNTQEFGRYASKFMLDAIHKELTEGK